MEKKKNYIWIYVLIGLIGTVVIGVILETIVLYVPSLAGNKKFVFSFAILAKPQTWAFGFFSMVILGVIYLINNMDNLGISSDKIFGNRKSGGVTSVLENSRFMTDKERDSNLPKKGYQL